MTTVIPQGVWVLNSTRGSIWFDLRATYQPSYTKLFGMFGRLTDWRRTSDLIEKRSGDLSGLSESGFGFHILVTVLYCTDAPSCQSCRQGLRLRGLPFPSGTEIDLFRPHQKEARRRATDLQLKRPFYEYVDSHLGSGSRSKQPGSVGGCTISIFGFFSLIKAPR